MRTFLLLVLGTANFLSNAACLPAQDVADVEANVGTLIEALRGEGEDARAAVDALVQIGPTAVPALIEALRDEDSRVELTVHALVQIGPAAVVALKETLKDEDPRVAELAAYALGQIGASAVPALREILNDEEGGVRFRAAWALGRVGPAAEAAMYDLVKALKDEDGVLRNTAAEALGNIGAPAKTAVPALIEALGDESENVREAAAEALAKIIESIRADMADLSVAERREATSNFTYVANALKSAGMDTERVQLAVEALSAELPAKPPAEPHSPAQGQMDKLPATAIGFCNEKKWPWAVVIYTVLLLFWAVVLLVWPRGIHATNELLRRLPEAKIKNPLEMTLSLRHVFLVGFFQHHSRVLDAWVQGCLATAGQNFCGTPTAKDREIHVSLPVRLDGETTNDLSGKTLRPALWQKQVRLLIQGEGGSGKTSLACQVARWAMGTEQAERITPHAMLPVLIEDELGKAGLIEVARAKLQELVGESHAISPDFFGQLLRKKRVLMIVGHLSEMSDATREQIWDVKADSSVAALVVTSRIEEAELGATTTLQTIPLKEDQVASFVRVYLTERKHANFFPDDEEYFGFCRHLASLGGDREITVLVAKFYLEQLAESKQDSALVSMPENIPDLMLRHVDERHPIGTAPDAVRVARQDAIQAAWQCVNEAFNPASVGRHEMLRALGGEDADLRLRYLRETLRVLRWESNTRDRVRFVSSPLAEYLAGIHVAERCEGDMERWKSFLDRADEKPVEKTKGFLLAVRDCCLASESVSDSVTDELARRGGLDLELVKRNRHRQRIRRLIGDLKGPDAEDRRGAADTLGAIGPGAEAAVPALVDTLQDSQSEVREAAACALGKIGSAAEVAVSALIQALEDEEKRVRGASAEGLGRIGSDAAVAVPALIEALKDEHECVVLYAAEALGRIGQSAKAAAPSLAEALECESPSVRETAADALGEIGPAAEAAGSMLVRALKDEAESVRDAAARALRKMDVAAAPALVEALRDENEPRHKHDAAMVLARIGPAAVPALGDGLKDVSEEVRLYASFALKEIGREATAALPALIEALKDEAERVRLNAAWALQGMGGEAKAAVPALIDASTDANGGVRHNAVLALGKIGPEAAAAVPTLVEALKDANDGVRYNAVIALGEIDREATTALPALIEALKDEDEDVRRAAADVLGRFDAPPS